MKKLTAIFLLAALMLSSFAGIGFLVSANTCLLYTSPRRRKPARPEIRRPTLHPAVRILPVHSMPMMRMASSWTISQS